MKQPKFTFIIDPKYDINYVKTLIKESNKWNSRIGEGDILARSISEIPNLKNLKELKKEEANALIKKEILAKYKELSTELEKSKASVEKEWKDIEEEYFAKVKNLFDNHDWPKGKYSAVLSILGSFPYDLDKNLIHFPYKELQGYSRIGVIMHESLHLMFFHFCKEKIKKKVNEKLLWDLSEIINPIIQNREPFLKMAGCMSYPYAAHSEQFIYLDSMFNKRKSMQSFIEEAILYLEKFEKENPPYQERIKLEKPPVLIEFKLIENDSKLMLKFNKPMSRGVCLISKENVTDFSNSKWQDTQTLIVPLKNFDKNIKYKVWLNGKNYMYFKSFTGKPLEPIEITLN